MARAAVITRPIGQSDALAIALEARSFEVFRWPAFEISPAKIDSSILEQQPDWIIFTSANAAHCGTNKLHMPDSAVSKIAVIGPATAQAVRDGGWPVDLMPNEPYNSESLLSTPPMQNVADKLIQIIRGGAGRGLLADKLGERGANVDYVDIYQRQAPKTAPDKLKQWIAEHPAALLLASSVEGLENLNTMAADADVDLYQLSLVAPAGRVVQHAATMGFSAGIFPATNATDAALVDAALQYTRELPDGHDLNERQRTEQHRR